MTSHKGKSADGKVNQLEAWLNEPCRARIAFATTPNGDVLYLTPMPANVRTLIRNQETQHIQNCPSCDHEAGTSLEFVELARGAWPDPETDGQASA